MLKVIALVGILLTCSCTDEEGSRRALQSLGFTNISFTGWKPFTCSQDDAFSTGFTATNSNKQRVEGVVCCGWLKNCTVRF